MVWLSTTPALIVYVHIWVETALALVVDVKYLEHFVLD